MNIVNHEALAGIDLRDEKLVERAVIDHCEALLDWIRPLSAREALEFVSALTDALEKRGRS